jgi:flagellar biosynthetic protein FliO
MSRPVLVFVLLLIAFGPLELSAAAPGPEPRTPNPEREYLAYQTPNPGGDSVGWITVRLFSSMALVGGLMAAGLYVYRRWVVRSPLGQRGELIRVVSRNYLGPKESLCLVKVGKELLLLGVTASQISSLHRWEEGAGPDIQGGDGGFARQMDGMASRLRLSGVESSIRNHLRTLQEHVAQLRSSAGKRPHA